MLQRKKSSEGVRFESGHRLFHAVNNTVFIGFTLLCFYPFYFMCISAISRNDYVDLGKITFFPQGIHFQNFINVFKLDRIWSATVVSLLRTGIGAAVCVVLSAYMAYLFTKRAMWGRTFFYRFTIATMYFSAGTIPVYLNIKMMGLLNSFWVYIIPGCISVYNMILTKTFIESLPSALEESAEIDGAGYLTRFFRIVLPLSTPIIATVALFSVVNHWNSFVDTKLYITDYRLFTLQYVLYEYYNHASSVAQSLTGMADMSMIDSAMKLSETSIKLTMSVVTIIPIVLVYPFIQRFYVKGLMVGSVKG